MRIRDWANCVISTQKIGFDDDYGDKFTVDNRGDRRATAGYGGGAAGRAVE
jgi:hypothetical protein